MLIEPGSPVLDELEGDDVTLRLRLRELLDPAFTDVRVEGHDIFRQEDGQENYQVSALLRLTFNYRHSIEDPEQ